MTEFRSRRVLQRRARPMSVMLAWLLFVLAVGCGTPGKAESPGPTATPVGIASSVTASLAAPAALTPAARASGNDTASAPEALSPRTLVSWRQEGLTPILIDVRAKWLCDQDRIPGALCIPAGELEARLADLSRDGEIVVYGGGYGDGDAAEVRAGAQLLLKKGFAKVYELQGGLADYAIVTAPSCGCKP